MNYFPKHFLLSLLFLFSMSYTYNAGINLKLFLTILNYNLLNLLKIRDKFIKDLCFLVLGEED